MRDLFFPYKRVTSKVFGEVKIPVIKILEIVKKRRRSGFGIYSDCGEVWVARFFWCICVLCGEKEEKQSVMAYRLKCPRTANGGLSHYMFGDSPADKFAFKMITGDKVKYFLKEDVLNGLEYKYRLGNNVWAKLKRR